MIDALRKLFQLRASILVDGTIIKVALEATSAFDNFDASFFQLEAKSDASSKELAMADKIVKDLPSPMSSAMIPPLGSWHSRAVLLVKMC